MMARVVSPALTASIQASTRVPAIAVSIEDHILHYQSYQTPNAADGWHDACLASDGSIVRVRLTRGSNMYAQSLQWQRITDPSNASQWTVWTTLGGASTTCFGDGGCAISNNNGVLRAFVQQGSGSGVLWTWSSSDNGQHWSATPGTVLTPPSNATLLGMGSAGNNDIFFLYQLSSGVLTGCSFFSGSSWSALRTTTLSALSYGAGLSAYWDGQSYWLVFSDGTTLYQSSYTPATTNWQGYPVIVPASGNAILRRAPCLRYDTSTGRYNLTCIEADSGSLTGAVYSYPRLRQSADLKHWSQGSILHSISAQYGTCFLSLPTGNLLISMSSIRRAESYSQSSQRYQDCSAAVISYRREEQLGQPGTLELELDNNQGALMAALSQSGSTRPIGPNCSVVVREGYHTGNPPGVGETVRVGTYRIESIELRRTAGTSRLRLLCRDLTRQLDLINRFQLTYVGQTLGWLLSEVCARAGLFAPVLPGASSQISQSVPFFVLPAGSSYRTALNELCQLYELQYFLDQDEVLQFCDLSSTSAASWSYRSELELLTFGQHEQMSNHIIVTGKPPVSATATALTTAEVYDDVQMQWSGQERVMQHVDQKLLTAAQCASKAAFLLARQQRAQSQHQIRVPQNPQHQLLDVLTIADQPIPTGTGQSSTVRIMRNRVVYDAPHAEFSASLELQGV
ncbi:hypothetical protein KDA_42910 [Dictyobacter alpinus]|uniref:Uncharacterized protein n=1 Tax=Dictyobacter alpinus TaxID=2014873 RepID=A0A402BC07_9CHLR|nr:hypothetical protein [Dictyobacter alpinus]GCE28807.1 hypothetical protein KDA_42910 [Dictyobacter alpinus]